MHFWNNHLFWFVVFKKTTIIVTSPDDTNVWINKDLNKSIFYFSSFYNYFKREILYIREILVIAAYLNFTWQVNNPLPQGSQTQSVSRAAWD